MGAHEVAVLLAVAGIAGGIWLFALLTDEVMEGGTQAFDRKVILMLHHSDGTPIGPPLLQEAARDITALGGVTVLTLLTLIAAGFLALDGKTHMAVFLLVSISSGALVDQILKNAFQRARPDLVPYSDLPFGSSFPSGHSLMSALTYLTLGALLARSTERNRLKAYFLLVAVLLTLAIGVTRVYLGVHWPTDVLAGWTVGAVWALICWLAARWLQARRTLEPEAQHANPA